MSSRVSALAPMPPAWRPLTAIALLCTSCCFGDFAPTRLSVHGRVIADDGAPVPDAIVVLYANDLRGGRNASPDTSARASTRADGTYDIEVGNVYPGGPVCGVEVLDEQGFSIAGAAVAVPESEPRHVEVPDVRLPTPGAREQLLDVVLAPSGGGASACTPRPLHRCVLYARIGERVRLWPPTDLDARPSCDAAPTCGGGDCRRSGVFVEDGATWIDPPREEVHEGELRMQCTEGYAFFAPSE